ncbi:MAG: MlaD family protein, partial [Cyanobium sp.]
MSPSPAPDPFPQEGAPNPRDRWLFLVSGGLLLLALLVAIGRERHWGDSTFAVDVVAPTAVGLQEGMEVRLSGMPIGRVKSLRLRDDARVEARLQINERYRHLVGPRSRAQSDQAGLVGMAFVSLTPDPRPKGEAAKALPALAYVPPPNLNQLVADLAESRKQLDGTLALTSQLLKHKVPPSLASLQQSTGKLSRSMEIFPPCPKPWRRRPSARCHRCGLSPAPCSERACSWGRPCAAPSPMPIEPSTGPTRRLSRRSRPPGRPR